MSFFLYGLLLFRWHFFSNSILFLCLISFPSYVFSIIIVVDHDTNGVLVLPWQHHLLCLHVLLSSVFLRFSQLFDSISVSECV